MDHKFHQSNNKVLYWAVRWEAWEGVERRAREDVEGDANSGLHGTKTLGAATPKL